MEYQLKQQNPLGSPRYNPSGRQWAARSRSNIEPRQGTSRSTSSFIMTSWIRSSASRPLQQDLGVRMLPSTCIKKECLCGQRRLLMCQQVMLLVLASTLGSPTRHECWGSFLFTITAEKDRRNPLISLPALVYSPAMHDTAISQWSSSCQLSVYRTCPISQLGPR